MRFHFVVKLNVFSLQAFAKEVLGEWHDHTRAVKLSKQLEQKRQERAVQTMAKPKHTAKRREPSNCSTVAWMISYPFRVYWILFSSNSIFF